ncbi:unnamed protein product [Calypogeia fissa]
MATPICDLHVDPLVPSEDLLAAVRRVCKVLVKDWANIDETTFGVSTITGGITNLLLKVWVDGKGVSPDTVTVRIFGANTEAVIDRNRELQALCHLSLAGFGAQLIGLFENGMVQSFIVASTLTPPELSKPRLAAHIAKELRRFHEAEVPGSREPQLWVDIGKFTDEASTVSFDDHSKQKTYDTISFIELREEIQALKKSCDCLEAPLVFAHNDLLSGNIMYNEDTDTLHLIDFEYSSYSYRGYDIGNHFNEYAGFDCDYSLYPKKEAQYHFFRHYLHSDSPNKATETELESLYVETNVYALASHLYWAVWAIVQARFSSIDFDYLGYFFLRYNEYKKKKTEHLQLIQLKNQKDSGIRSQDVQNYLFETEVASKGRQELGAASLHHSGLNH